MLLTAISRFFSQLEQSGFKSDANSSTQTKPTFWLGYSGGLDSSVLFALCAKYHKTRPFQFKIIHIHHGLHPHADTWSKHCAKVSQQYGFDFLEHRIQIQLKSGESLEETAREYRYAALASYMNEGDVLLTAHQQDDQAETVLLQLLRGAGPKGLAAMPLIIPFAKGRHARPLLNFPRAELERYAVAHQLKWIDDPSNDDQRLTRNYIRHEILPRLKERWPAVNTLLARSAAHCAEAQVLLEDISASEWFKIAGLKSNTLSVAKLLQLNPAKQRLVLRTWIDQSYYPLPDQKKLETICQSVLLAKSDRMPCVRWQTVELRRYRDDLFLMQKLMPHDVQKIYDWDGMKPLFISGLGKLTAVLSRGYGLRGDIRQVSVRFRCGGESYQLGKRGKHHLKNLFQEWGVPPWERNRIPLIFVGDQLAMVLGYYLSEEYAAKADEMGYSVVLEMAANIEYDLQ